MSRLVTVATFGSATELMLARTRLTAAGIRTFVPDELALATADYLAPGLGGFRLAVHESLLDDARALLEDPVDDGARDDEDDEDGDGAGLRCGTCGSSYVALERRALARIGSLLFFGLFRRWERPTWRCRRCGHPAEETPAPEPDHPYRDGVSRRPAPGPARSDRGPTSR